MGGQNVITRMALASVLVPSALPCAVVVISPGNPVGGGYDAGAVDVHGISGSTLCLVKEKQPVPAPRREQR